MVSSNDKDSNPGGKKSEDAKPSADPKQAAPVAGAKPGSGPNPGAAAKPEASAKPGGAANPAAAPKPAAASKSESGKPETASSKPAGPTRTGTTVPETAKSAAPPKAGTGDGKPSKADEGKKAEPVKGAATMGAGRDSTATKSASPQPAGSAAGGDKPGKTADKKAAAGGTSGSSGAKPGASGSGGGTPPTVPPATAEKRGGGFVPGLVGGIAAAVVGFGAAQFLDVDWVKMSGGQDPVATQLAEQNTAITGQSQSIATLESRLEAISQAVASPDLSSMEKTITDLASQVESEVGSLSSGIVTQLGQVTETLSGLSDAVGTIETRLTGVDGSLSDLEGGLKGVTDQLGTVETSLSGVDDRLVAVEKRPMVESSETAKSTFDAYEREVQRLTDELSKQQEESAATAKRMAELASLTEQQITAVQEEAAARLASMQAEASSQIDANQAETDAKVQEAQSTAQSASVTAALISLEKSLEEGTPYADALATIGGSAEVPDALSAEADNGVQTLMQLRDSYPQAARAALEASIRETSQSADPVGKLAAFFRHQTGARSLAPKEGDHADAVLSRAEASVDSGDIPAALAELDALPENGQAAMSDWTSAATARVEAVAAAATLVASMQTN